MIYKRVEKSGEKWHEVLYAVLLTYNQKLVHSSTKFTPAEAMKPQNHLDVKLNLELRAEHKRKYPDVKVGDFVKVYRKKDKLQKERVPLWSKETFKVVDIVESMGQEFYKLEGRPKLVQRSEILLVS